MNVCLRLLLLPLSAVLCFIAYSIYNIYLHPLRNVPGPRIAAATQLWDLFISIGGRAHHHQIALHEKYGPLVRIAPNRVMFNNPAYLQQYFNMNKSIFWRAFKPHPTILSHGAYEDVKEHSVAKRKILSSFQMPEVMANEEKINRHIDEFGRQIAKREGRVFDIAPWFQFAAFDVVMDMVFSDPVGFLKAGYDVNSIISIIHGYLKGAITMGMLPYLADIMAIPWIFNLVAPKPTDKTGPGVLQCMANDQVQDRLSDLEHQKGQHRDVLQSIIDKSLETERLTVPVLQMEALNPILAGSDTTAVHMRAVLLFVNTNRRVLAKLTAEIDEADRAGRLSRVPTYNEIKQNVPYFEMVHRETMRIFPVAGMVFPRQVTDPTGITISGHHIPAGIDVGLSQWALGRNRSVYGDDVEMFNPERWSDEGLSEEQKKLRDRAYVPWHGGVLVCTGKHIAMLEIYKVMVQLFRVFDFEVVRPNRPWKEKNVVVVMCTDFDVIARVREGRHHLLGSELNEKVGDIEAVHQVQE